MHRLAKVRRCDLTAAVKIGELDNAEPGKCRSQIRYRNFKPVHLEPGRFHPITVTHPGPVAANPACPSATSPTYPCFRAQPAEHVLDHEHASSRTVNFHPFRWGRRP